jgi:hypothetical protein
MAVDAVSFELVSGGFKSLKQGIIQGIWQPQMIVLIRMARFSWEFRVLG